MAKELRATVKRELDSAIERELDRMEADGMFDDAPEIDGGSLYELELQPGLTDEEIKDAQFMKRVVRGIMIVTGMPRQGKGLFAIATSWKLKRFYARRILLDFRPRRAFGIYEMFNETVFADEAYKMAELAKGATLENTSDKEQKAILKDASNIAMKCVETYGQVMLEHSVLVLDEFHRYMHNRRPFNPMGILLGRVLKLWGHLDILVIGIAQQKRELDRISCLPYITHEVRCSWCETKPDTAQCTLYPVKYVYSSGMLQVKGKAKPLFVNGRKPRQGLPGGYYSLYNTKNIVPITAPHYKGDY